jgi:hypothetical protein
MTRAPMFRDIDSDSLPPPLDPRELETALSLGDTRDLVLDALRSGDWSAVDALPVIDLTGQVGARMVA